MATLQLDCTCTFVLKSTIPYNIILMHNILLKIKIIIGNLRNKLKTYTLMYTLHKHCHKIINK